MYSLGGDVGDTCFAYVVLMFAFLPLWLYPQQNQLRGRTN